MKKGNSPEVDASAALDDELANGPGKGSEVERGEDQ